jgi:hypothetical protein
MRFFFLMGSPADSKMEISFSSDIRTAMKSRDIILAVPESRRPGAGLKPVKNHGD